jgi:succinate dehydrogenase / fumarate reductase flavoprotein subunit
VAGAFGYDREKGLFILWQAKAVVIATGGIGRAYKVTSNSWEYTGDGHALAYRAGAELLDMELRRFMFDDIPENYRTQTADSEEEGWLYTQGDKNARRPPELLTRDHVARCINREVKAGRGSPHGGVYLDIAWIKQKLPKAAEHIKRKLPSMYHQFKQLADIDITKEPMEVGPTTHYMMGGVRVDGDSQMSTVPGLFAAGEAAAGLHGANRLGGNSLSDLLVFGKRAGQFAAEFAKSNGAPRIDNADVDRSAKWALQPFEHGPSAENPYSIQHELQERMQELVGIVRTEDEMEQALKVIDGLNARAERAGIAGNRQYNNGWHTAMDLPNLLVVSEAVTRAALMRKESRGAQFREDFPDKDPEWGKYNIVVRRGDGGEMLVEKRQVQPLREDLGEIIQEMK